MRLGACLAAGVAVGVLGFAAAGSEPLLHTTFFPIAAPGTDVEVVVERRGMEAGSVQLTEDGAAGNHAASVREFRATGYGVTAVLAIDSSGSIRGAQFDAVRQALSDFVASSRAQDRIAIVSFADTVDVRQGFTADKAQLTKAIGAIEAHGRTTVLFRAISESLKMLAAEPANPRRHLLVITDGKNESPGFSIAELQKQARSAGIPVDCIGVTRLAARFLAPMQSLAAGTGGAYVRARGYEGLRAAMGEGIQGLLQSPVMTFHLAHVKPDGARHLLQVKASGASTDAVSLLLPAAPRTPLTLYLSIGFAALLSGGGLALLVYSRRRQVEIPAAPAPAPVPVPLESSPAEAPVASHRQRTRTVYSPAAGVVNPEPVAAPAPPRVLAQSASPAAPYTPPPVAAFAPPAAAPTPAAPQRNATQFRHAFAEPAPGHPAAWLQEGDTGPRFPIELAETWIGAEEGNHIVLAGDASASRNHACLQWAAGDLYLFDNRSTNGTRVNGVRMESGARIRLQLGDHISIAHSAFTLES